MEKKKYQLPREFGEKWVKALRSGEYGQYKGMLNDPINPKCYCANGLAYAANGYTVDYNVAIKGSKKINVYGTKGIVKEELFDNIWRLNDRAGFTFPEIATWIETNVEFI